MITTNVYQEICCDECNDTIHNHFDCPVCNGRGYQGTDQYSYIDRSTLTIQCEDCNNLFERVNVNDDFIALRNHIRKFNKKVNRKIKIKKVLDKLNISVSLQS